MAFFELCTNALERPSRTTQPSWLIFLEQIIGRHKINHISQSNIGTSCINEQNLVNQIYHCNSIFIALFIVLLVCNYLYYYNVIICYIVYLCLNKLNKTASTHFLKLLKSNDLPSVLIYLRCYLKIHIFCLEIF